MHHSEYTIRQGYGWTWKKIGSSARSKSASDKFIFRVAEFPTDLFDKAFIIECTIAAQHFCWRDVTVDLQSACSRRWEAFLLRTRRRFWRKMSLPRFLMLGKIDWSQANRIFCLWMADRRKERFWCPSGAWLVFVVWNTKSSSYKFSFLFKYMIRSICSESHRWMYV